LIKLSSPSTREFWELPVVYEDEHLLVLDKPAGLLTAPESDAPDEANLIDLLHQGIAQAKPWATTRGLSYLMYPQPLGAEASGVLLLAKTKEVLTKLADVFGSEQPLLSFVALVLGVPAENHFSVEAKLAPHPMRAGSMSVDSKLGKRARSSFEVMERFAGWTLLKCVPLTWRQHQLRVHLAYARLPVAGDEEYRGKPLLLSSLKPGYHLKPKHSERPLLGRPCIHAEQLALNHPVTGQPLVVHAPWPKPLVVALKYLRKYAALG
jgi:RluA family pseudouridine synthase